MRILFDQGTPIPLRKEFIGHEVVTAHELAWSSLSNGDLLREAEAQFDVLVTTDQNLRYQQNLIGRRLAIFVLPTTSWPLIRPHARKISEAVLSMRPGEYQLFTLPD
jgi:hypothetical protein